MLGNFAFSILPFFYFSLKPKQHTLKPISFSLRQMSRPLHGGLNGFHSPQMVKMPVLLGYLGSQRSTSCCQVRSPRCGKCRNGVWGGADFTEVAASGPHRRWKTARPALSLGSEGPGWAETGFSFSLEMELLFFFVCLFNTFY